MLAELFPRACARYASLPVIGRYLDRFAIWLRDQGHSPLPIIRRIQAAPQFDALLQRRHVSDPTVLSAKELIEYIPANARNDFRSAAFVRSLVEYFDQFGMLSPPPLTPARTLVDVYRTHLFRDRAFAASTVQQHVATLQDFLEFIGYDVDPNHLRSLGLRDLEGFIQRFAARRSRTSLQHVVAHLRAFLRYFAGRGLTSADFAPQIDTPRTYRGERLPRALPWRTVLDFLAAIDRSSIIGRRDYAMFLLIATYGLRASEVVTLSLDGIKWRTSKIHVPRQKVNGDLILPLTEEVGAAITDYLRRGRPVAAQREVFLRVRSPQGRLKPTAVTEAFQHWTRRSRLPIVWHGAHCLRHSLAMHLLRQGETLKTIGDLLGHRSAESTCVYLRLHVEDLREVALDLPDADEVEGRQ